MKFIGIFSFAMFIKKILRNIFIFCLLPLIIIIIVALIIQINQPLNYEVSIDSLESQISLYNKLINVVRNDNIQIINSAGIVKNLSGGSLVDSSNVSNEVVENDFFSKLGLSQVINLNATTTSDILNESQFPYLFKKIFNNIEFSKDIVIFVNVTDNSDRVRKFKGYLYKNSGWQKEDFQHLPSNYLNFGDNRIIIGD